MTVTSNANSPGTATATLNSASMGSCSVSTIIGNFPASVSLQGLPYQVEFADSPGLPVTIDNVSLSAAEVGETCTFSANLNGSADNVSHGFQFSNQGFNLMSDTGSNCSSGTESVSLNGVVDEMAENFFVYVN